MSKEEYQARNEVDQTLPGRIFSSEEFNKRVREVFRRTNKALAFAWKEHHILQVPEFGFLIFKQRKGERFSICPVQQGSEIRSMSGAEKQFSYIQLIRHLMTVGGNPELFAYVHFHEPWEKPLIPSVYAVRNGGQVGDLYSLLVLRRNAVSQPLPYFYKNVIGIIGKVRHPDYFENPVEFLFYQETEKIQGLPENKLLSRLQELQEFLLEMRSSLSQEDVLKILRRLGYKAEYFAVPKERYLQGGLFSSEDLKRIAAFAH